MASSHKSDGDDRAGAKARAKARNIMRGRDGSERRRKYEPRNKAPGDVELFSRSVMACFLGVMAGVIVFAVLWVLPFVSPGLRVLISLACGAVGFWIGLNRDGWEKV